jgi:hypothetical protein
MRRGKRWGFVLLVGVSVVGLSYVAAYRYGRRPAAASVTVVGKESKGGSLLVSALAANTGRVPLIYRGWPPCAELRVKTNDGWTNVPQRYLSPSSSFGFLLPGRSLAYSFTVPLEVTHVQVECYFETGGARTLVAARLIETGWWNRLLGFWERVLPLLPDGKKEHVKFSSVATPVN